MASAFDPYHKWLAIPPSQQPPNHYRLLGVPLFEQDADVIESAADRQMAHVRRFATGQHSEVSQRLLNEISAARLALLNAEKRTAYDAALRAKQQASRPPVAPALEQPHGSHAIPTAQPLAQPAARTESPQLRTRAGPVAHAAPAVPIVTGHSRSAHARRSPALAIFLLGGAVAIVAVVAIVLLRRGDQPGADQAAQHGDTAPTEVAQSKPKSEATGAGAAKTPVPSDTPDTKTPAAKSDSTTADPAAKSKDKPTPKDPVEGSPAVAVPTPGKKEDDSLESPATEPAVFVATSVASDGVDLLNLIDPARDALDLPEHWKLEDHVLFVPDVERGRLQVHYQPPEYYSLTLEVERVNGNRHLLIGLPLGGDGKVSCAIDVERDGRFTSGLFNGESELQVARFDAPLLPVGKKVRISCLVDEGRLVVRAGTKSVANWKRDGTKLSLGEAWQVPDEGAIVIGSWQATFRISKLELHPVLRPATTVVVDTGPRPRPRVDLSDLLDPSRGSDDEPGSAPRAKLPVPEEDQQKKTLEIVRELYKDEYAAARTPADKLKLARRLLDSGRQTNDDPQARFVLLSEAVHWATEGGDAGVADAALKLLAREYVIDVAPLRAAALAGALKAARLPEEHRRIVPHVIDAIEEAEASDRFEDASKLMRLAQSAARAGNDADATKQVANLARRLREGAAAFDKVKAHQETLSSKPDDPDANAAWGQYLCMTKNSWESGLPHLAKGSDARLQAAAKAELTQPTDAKGRIALADQWFSIAGGFRGTEQAVVQLHAETWYRKGVTELAGLEKARVEKRLKEMAKIDRTMLPKPRGGAVLEVSVPTDSDSVLLGRCRINGQLAPLLAVYRPGEVIRNDQVRAAMTKYGADISSELQFSVYGALSFQKPTPVAFHLVGGSSSGGVVRLLVNNREIAAVGDDREKDKIIIHPFPAGTAIIVLVIHGGDLGQSKLELYHAETSRPIPVNGAQWRNAVGQVANVVELDLANPQGNRAGTLP